MCAACTYVASGYICTYRFVCVYVHMHAYEYFTVYLCTFLPFTFVCVTETAKSNSLSSKEYVDWCRTCDVIDTGYCTHYLSLSCFHEPLNTQNKYKQTRHLSGSLAVSFVGLPPPDRSKFSLLFVAVWIHLFKSVEIVLPQIFIIFEFWFCALKWDSSHLPHKTDFYLALLPFFTLLFYVDLGNAVWPSLYL